MKKHYCPICGNELESAYEIGDICPCCRNECDFSDDVLAEELVKFCDKDFESAGYDKHKLAATYPDLPQKMARQLLRAQWINNQDESKLNIINKEMNNRSITRAEKQLRNINVDIHDYLKSYNI